MRSQQDKENALEHIAYEIDMLDFLYNQLVKITDENRPIRTSAEKHLEDTLLDAFVIHAENLFHFYYKPGDDRDIVAHEYVNNITSFENERVPEKEIVKIADITIKRNKQVAHLTWGRVDTFGGGKKYWDWNEIYLKLKTNQEVFIKNLSQDIKTQLLLQIGRMSRSDFDLPQVSTYGRGCTGPSPSQ